MKVRLTRIIVSAVLFAAASIVGEAQEIVRMVLFAAAYLIVGYDVLWSAVRSLASGGLISESFLMSIATIGAFAIGEYPEGVLVMLLYQIGELFQSFAVGKSRKSIAELMDIRPDTATVRRDGELQVVDPDDVEVGDIIVIKPGERVPLDSEVIEGFSNLDMAALTGESAPQRIGPGEALLSGAINETGLLTARVTKPFGESTVSRILELVEHASGNKSRQERFITRFARVYTPIVVGLAVLMCIIPPLVTGQPFSEWLYRALSFLVVSCPCALVISVPLSFFGGIGGASRKGILVKGGNDLEALAKAQIVVMDKTGTLTRGVFDVQAVHAESMDHAELMELTAHAESGSTHPISQSIQRAHGKPIDESRISDMEEVRGHGIRAKVDGRDVAAGNARMMERMQIDFEPDDCEGTIVHTAVDGVYAGHMVIADTIKPDAKQAIDRLRAENVKQIVMLTGDSREVGERVAASLGLDSVKAELLPGDKVTETEKLMAQRTGNGTLVFVGDGINDAPVLARADVGVAMGGLGSDAAIEAADVVIMTDEPSKLATGIAIAKRTLRIANQNIVFALAVKAAALLLSAMGQATMLAAVFADVGVTFLAILNAMRALKTKD